MADFVFDPRVFYTYNQLQGDVGLSITDPLFSRSRESLSSLRPVEPRDSRTPPAVWEERLDSASLPYSRTGDDRDAATPRSPQPKSRSAGGRDARQLRVPHFGRLAVIHEVLERGQGAWADPLQLVGDQRLEQPPERAALQDNLGSARQQRLIALWLHAPLVPRRSQEWNPHTLVGGRAPLVPGEPALADRGVTAEQAGDGSPDLAWLLAGSGGEAHLYLAGDRLPFGIDAFPGREHNDLVLWIEGRNAVIAGDSLADFGRGFEIPREWLRRGVTREQIAEGLRPLLALPVEVVLPAHGAPTDRAALERALA